MLRRFVGGFSVEGHERRGASRNAGDLRPPFVEAHARDLDEVLAPIDDFFEAMNIHGFRPMEAICATVTEPAF